MIMMRRYIYLCLVFNDDRGDESGGDGEDPTRYTKTWNSKEEEEGTRNDSRVCYGLLYLSFLVTGFHFQEHPRGSLRYEFMN